MPCTKAIIAIAGYGGRRVPITKAIEKCMLPVGNRPIVDYIVDDCIAAGITDIVLVVGEQSRQVRTYYGHNQLLEAYLAAHHSDETLAQVTALATKARFSFVVQDSTQPYGTTVPLWLARDCVEPGESFLYLYGDNIFYRPQGGSAIAAFLAKADGAATAMLVNEVPYDQVSHYGIVGTEERHGREFFSHIAEKPRREDAPSNLSNSGCFLLQQSILKQLERGMAHPGKEKYFTDPLNWHHEAGNNIAVVRLDGTFLDCGSVEGWLDANNRIVGHSV